MIIVPVRFLAVVLVLFVGVLFFVLVFFIFEFVVLFVLLFVAFFTGIRRVQAASGKSVGGTRVVTWPVS